ncbi:MAG: DUF5677 domain-containing protein [Coriobacteriia bacterium]
MTADEYLAKLHGECLRLSGELKFDKTHALHFTLLAQLGSILELAGAVVQLRRTGCGSAVPSVLRTMLETYVDLKNLCADAAYGYHLEAADLAQWLKLLEKAAGGTNPYLKAIAERPHIDRTRQTWTERKAQLDSQGYRPLRVSTRFSRADMTDEYDAIYNMLSADAHSNHRALLERHLTILPGDFEVTFYKDADQSHYVLLAAVLLLDATKLVHEALAQDASAALESLSAQLIAIQRQAQAEA